MRTGDPEPSPTRRVLVSGSSGLIGGHFVTARRAAGDTVVRLVRGGAPAFDTVLWNAGIDALDPATVSGFDAVVHLAGEPVAGRWTAEKKQRITESRVRGTAVLSAALAAAERPPAVFVCASGINFYGNTGDSIVDENSAKGTGFLADVCEGWEGACAALASVTRVVNLRIGVVLASDGGMLPTLLPLYRLGLGGTIGAGRGYVSWVTLDDAIRAAQYAVESETLRGPVNLVAPAPVTGKQLTQALAAAVGRPAFIPVPGWLMRVAMGQMAEETVLGSVRAVPGKLLGDGFRFKDATLSEALRACGIQPR